MSALTSTDPRTDVAVGEVTPFNTIQAEWDSFSSQVIPNEAPETQKEEMKLAFYAGVHAILSIMANMEQANFSEEAGGAVLNSLFEETDAFIRSTINMPEAQG